MLEFSRSYLKKYYDNFQFFDLECDDRRIREVYMRTRRCLRCPGLSQCRMHPEFWLEGEGERLTEDMKLREIEKAQGIVYDEEEEEEYEEEEEIVEDSQNDKE
ncbi:MAG: hypothetical protein AB2L14_29705 [Candidatus Xenobiia bacterium LiM19]